MRSTAILLSLGLCFALSARVQAQSASDSKSEAAPDEHAGKASESAKSAKSKPKPKEDQRKLEDWGEHRVLNGHAFPFATFVDPAFAMSFVGVTGGLEYHRVPRVPKPIAFIGDTGTQLVDLQELNVEESLQFGLRLHELFALFGDAYGHARVGVDTNTLLGNGGDYRYGGDFGALVRVLRVGPFQLALRGQAGLYAGQQAGILGLFHDLGNIVNDAFNRIIQNPMIDLNSTLALVNNAFRSASQELLVPFSGFTYGGSVNAALAFDRYFGAQFALGVSGDSAFFEPRLYDATTGGAMVFEQRSTTISGRGAIAIDADGAPVGVPLDVMLEYALTLSHLATHSATGSSSNDSVEHLIALGLFYSGRPDLQLGMTFYGLLGQVPLLIGNRSLSGEPVDVGGLLVFRYIW